VGRLAVTVSLSILIQACASPPGGSLVGSPDAGLPVSRHLAVDPHAEMLRAGAAPVLLTATLTGAEGPISWSLSGPGSLGSTSGDTVSYTPPDTIDATAVATVTASAPPDLVDVVTITVVPAAAIDVAGRVVGPTGAGLAGLTVGVGGKTAVSGADGRFSIPAVLAPYDLTVSLAGTPLYVGRYEGLTRPDPTISFLWLFSSGEPNTATISGTVSGGDEVGAAGEFTTAIFTTSDVRFDLTAIGITARNNPFTFPVSWFGQESITAAVHVVQFKSQGPGQPPTEYTGYGVHSGIALGKGAAVESADVTLTRPGTGTIGGTVVPPDGYALTLESLGLELAGLTAVPLGHVETSATDFTFAVPEGIDAVAAVTVTAQRAGGGSTSRRVSGLTAGQSDVSIPLPVPALQTSPVDGAGGVNDATVFSWTPVEHGVHLVLLDGGATSPSFYVVTAATSARIAGLPGGATYHWLVGGFGPFDSVDAFAGGPNLFPALGSSFTTVSEQRSFVVD